jgi:hypothetical protein
MNSRPEPRGITLNSVCDSHANRKTLDPKRRQHTLTQLRAEGHKRIESFLFEQIFSRHVINCCGVTNVSLGWSFQRNVENVPTYWFKLNLPESEWNVCDERVAQFLLGLGCEVVIVEYSYEERRFYGNQYLNGSHGNLRPLDVVLSELTARRIRGDIREARVNASFQQKAIDAIALNFSDTELYHLSLSRLLIGCYLAPWFSKQPMDLDVCCLVNGHLRMIEFKRKYPARSGLFGIDTDPHGYLVDWLEQVGESLLHVILVDPLWNHTISPTHLLENHSVTASEAMWIGAWLTSRSFTDSYFETHGADSGMFHGDRTQRQIRSNAFHLIERGLQLTSENLATFLNDPGKLPLVTIAMLENARDIARDKYRH